MKKLLVIGVIILAFMGVTLVGCKDKNDTIDTQEENVTDTNTNDEQISDQADTDDLESEDSVELEDDTDQVDTVTEDAYEPGIIEVTEDMIEIEEALVGQADLDDATLAEIAALVDFAYYNYLWDASLESEALTTENMQRFAISYIYQYEYNELFFDTTDFVLYIPEDHVTHIIDLFFDANFVNHQIESSLVTYDDGYYLMPAIDVGNLYEPSIVSVVETSDFSYKVTYQSSDPNQSVDESDIYYELGIEQRDGRFIYTSYQMKIIHPEAPEVEEEATEDN